jgi:hypothetical protein
LTLLYAGELNRKIWLGNASIIDGGFSRHPLTGNVCDPVDPVAPVAPVIPFDPEKISMFIKMESDT